MGSLVEVPRKDGAGPERSWCAASRGLGFDASTKAKNMRRYSNGKVFYKNVSKNGKKN